MVDRLRICDRSRGGMAGVRPSFALVKRFRTRALHVCAAEAFKAARAKQKAMPKHLHEIRDPIHVFVRLDSDERRVLDSRAFQRLRHIHQLALTYLLYPAATHKRFEHSLGVMELAARVFDVVTHRDHVTDDIRRELPEIGNEDRLRYWRRVLRMAALCHDMGHLPFSHAAEADLLPQDWSHPADVATNPEAGRAVFEAAKAEFGPEAVRHDKYTQKGGAKVFPVLLRDGRIASSVAVSETLEHLPLVAVDYVFIVPEKLNQAEQWLRANRASFIQPSAETP